MPSDVKVSLAPLFSVTYLNTHIHTYTQLADFPKKHTPLLCMGTMAARAHGAQMFLPLDNKKKL